MNSSKVTSTFKKVVFDTNYSNVSENELNTKIETLSDKKGTVVREFFDAETTLNPLLYEKKFREHMKKWEFSKTLPKDVRLYRTEKQIIGMFLGERNPNFEIMQWFIQTKKDEYPQECEDLQELLNIIEYFKPNLTYLEEGLLERLREFGLGIRIRDSVGDYPRTCYMCGVQEFNNPKLYIDTESISGDYFDSGYTDYMEIDIEMDRINPFFTEIDFMVDEKRVREWENELEKKSRMIPPTITEAKNAISNIEVQHALLNNIKKKKYRIHSPEKVCEKCLYEERTTKKLPLCHPFDRVDRSWLTIVPLFRHCPFEKKCGNFNDCWFRITDENSQWSDEEWREKDCEKCYAPKKHVQM